MITTVKEVGAPGGSRTRKIQFLRLTCIPVPSPGRCYLVDGVGFEPTAFTTGERIYSPSQYHHHCSPSFVGGSARILTENILLLRQTRLPIAPQTRDYLSRYRSRKGWSGRWGSNPRHPVSETGTLPTELRPEVGGRGRLRREVFITRAIIVGNETKVNYA